MLNIEFETLRFQNLHLHAFIDQIGGEIRQIQRRQDRGPCRIKLPVSPHRVAISHKSWRVRGVNCDYPLEAQLFSSFFLALTSHPVANQRSIRIRLFSSLRATRSAVAGRISSNGESKML
jgi:hypothetical protein